MRPLKLLVIGKPNARYLTVLEQLPDDTTITVGDTPEAFQIAASEADVVLNGMNAGQTLRSIWPSLQKVRWVHSLSAGVENALFPELIASPTPVTNSRGLFKRSLAEFVIASILFYAKDLRRMLKSQAADKWEPFDIEEIHGRTLGVVGYGEIGRECAQKAYGLGMRIVATRRRPELLDDDPMVDHAFAIDARRELMAASDYIVAAAPSTPETRGLIGEAEIGAMKPSGVLINVGRGPVIDEAALIRALEERRIRGAALDVYDTEPLPAGHPFWRMENVLLSPHCADHTPTWLEEAMQFFVSNFDRFRHGQPLENIVDKHAGY